MNFERGNNPIKSMDIGCGRKIKKGDRFTIIFPSTPTNPEFEEEVVAEEDEESHEHRYVEKVDMFGQTEYGGYEVRQVKFISSEGLGTAEMRDNCEFPRWEYTGKPETFMNINPEDGSIIY